jgi:sugar-specific transcriptional regulator TrmB
VVNSLTQELAGLLGLTDYEARAYLGLLREGPLTGYAMSKASGIPTSKSYEAAEGLARKGGAVTLPGEPVRYAAIPPDALLSQARHRHTAALEHLAATLADLSSAADPAEAVPPLWHATSEAGLAHTAGRLAAARRSIIGALPSVARDALETALTAAAGRGVLVQIVSSGDDLMTLLLDDREAILASLGDPPEIIGTGNPAAVALSRMRLRAASASPFLRPSDDMAEWLRWEEQKGLRLLTTRR